MDFLSSQARRNGACITTTQISVRKSEARHSPKCQHTRKHSTTQMGQSHFLQFSWYVVSGRGVHIFSQTLNAEVAPNLFFIKLALTVNFLEGIITRPIVQKSRESNIPLWLTVSLWCFAWRESFLPHSFRATFLLFVFQLPTIGCFAIGAYRKRRALTSMLFVLSRYSTREATSTFAFFIQSDSYLPSFAAGAITLFSPSSVSQRNAGTDQFWPGVLYLCAAVLYLVACLLGYFISHYNILNSRDKKTKSVS